MKAIDETETETTFTVTDFCHKYGINIESEAIDRNPYNTDWTEADHWKVQLSRQFEGIAKYTDRQTGKTKRRTYRYTMTTYFSMGYAYNGREPKVDEVLDVLKSESSSADGVSFESWANDLGYDPDSRKAEHIYKACCKTAGQLKRFLGDGLYQELLTAEGL